MHIIYCFLAIMQGIIKKLRNTEWSYIIFSKFRYNTLQEFFIIIIELYISPLITGFLKMNNDFPDCLFVDFNVVRVLKTIITVPKLT